MPGIAYSGPVIGTETEAVLLRHKDWPNFDHPAAQRVPLVPIKNKTYQISAPWLNTSCKFQSKAPSPHDPSQVLMSSSDSDNDLAAMVHDFIENGGSDGYDSSDKEPTASTGFAAFFETLKSSLASGSFVERELRCAVIRILSSMSEEGMICRRGFECKGHCIRSLLVKCLRTAGYNAGICKTRWQSTGRVPGGEYEYIDVETAEERLVVDLDFHSHFEIARPIQLYKAAVRLLPPMFIGSPRKLKQILQVMSNAAKCSLKQSSMHLPPWRTFDYMSAKWLSPYERETDNLVRPANGDGSSKLQQLDKKGCSEQLKRMKACLRQEVDKCLPVKAQPRGRHNPLRRGSS